MEMENRRPIASRNKSIFHQLARVLVKCGLTPNMISLSSILFALVGAFGFYVIAKDVESFWVGISLCFIGIQLRLICNLIDGLMAVEGGLKSPQGDLYNEVPDRLSDWALILATGFIIGKVCSFGWQMSWIASMLAVLTAYVRALGASIGVGNDFGGPMAKPHRMAVLNLGLVTLIIEHLMGYTLGRGLYICVLVIALGSLLTCFLRLRRASKKLGENFKTKN